ncbi:MAG: transposase family protein [Polyangiaceae bacterium]|nr:transposase family protein [Polyangiaceae bacterium]MBP9107751.1 transposase family protein [Gemmatimonadaceae bacterium]
MDRSNHFVVHPTFDVNFWAARTPTVEAARPARCPRCKVASRRPGMRLGLVGHGLRDRQVRGPRAPAGRPITVVIPTRRFLCVECAAVVTVAPRGVVRRRHFGAAAIGLALFLFGVLERSARGVQRAISGWGLGASCWRTLARWIEAARSRALLRAPRASLDGLARRQVAALVGRSVQALAAASAGGDLERVFAGSEQLR